MYTLYLDFNAKKEKKIVLKNCNKKIGEVIFSDDNSIGAIENLLKKHKLTIDDIEFCDFKEDVISFTGARIASSISNTINFYKGNVRKYSDIKLPKYSGEAHLTWSSKNT